MGLVVFGIYVLLLVTIPIVIGVWFPLDGASIGATAFVTYGLTLGALLIAVVGMLLSIFVSQGLKNTNEGKWFRTLIYMLCGGIIGSFFVGATSIWLVDNPDCPLLLDAMGYILVSVLYTVTVSMISVTINIVRW